MAENKRGDWLPQLSEQLRRWLDAPEQRTLRDQVQRVWGSPQGRALHEQLRRLTLLRQQQQLPTLVRQLDQTPAKRKRKPGGGRKPELTAKETKKMRQRYQIALRRDPELRRPKVALGPMRDWLPKAKRTVSDSTLRRRVIRPVLDEISK
jgi:hypothetical protein